MELCANKQTKEWEIGGGAEGRWGREVEGEVTTLFWIQIQGKLKVQSEYR